MAKIEKIANHEKETPPADIIAIYVESLQLYRKEMPGLKQKYCDLIDSLPSPRQIRKTFSIEETKILFETVGFLWRTITKEDLITEMEIERAPDSLLGNYWIVKNGILLHGINHYGIIKQNATLICALLNINGFALQHYLCARPLEVIDFIIRNGGVRMLVRKDKKAFFQMSEDTYAKWGKYKVKRFDFVKKITKVLDPTLEYKGWSSGIPILL